MGGGRECGRRAALRAPGRGSIIRALFTRARPPSWKIQVALSPQRIIRFTPCLILGCGFRGRWIEWRYFLQLSRSFRSQVSDTSEPLLWVQLSWVRSVWFPPNLCRDSGPAIYRHKWLIRATVTQYFEIRILRL